MIQTSVCYLLGWGQPQIDLFCVALGRNLILFYIYFEPFQLNILFAAESDLLESVKFCLLPTDYNRESKNGYNFNFHRSGCFLLRQRGSSKVA